MTKLFVVVAIDAFLDQDDPSRLGGLDDSSKVPRNISTFTEPYLVEDNVIRLELLHLDALLVRLARVMSLYQGGNVMCHHSRDNLFMDCMQFFVLFHHPL